MVLSSISNQFSFSLTDNDNETEIIVWISIIQMLYLGKHNN